MRSLPLRAALLTGSVVVAPLLLATGPGAMAQVPPPLPSELPTLPGEEPSEPPEPSPSPSGEPTADPSRPDDEPGPTPSPRPTPKVADPSGDGPRDEPSDTPSGGQGSLPGFPVAPDPGSPGSGDGGEAPQVAPRDGGTPARPAADGPASVTVVGVDRVAAALPGTFGIGLLTALLGVATLSGTLSLTRRGLLLATDANGGTDVATTRRWRVMAGVALLAAAGLIGIIGYLKISLETLVPVQIVYLASAGFGVVVLAAAGGALLVSEQLRADESRLREIETALVTMADHLGASVSDPPRLLGRDDDTDDA
jgi:hypothetical protein